MKKRTDKEIIEDIGNASTKEILELQKRSARWFESHIRSLASDRNSYVRKHKTPKLLLASGETRGTIQPGAMYGFFYDPKTKETLPYYDKFPLVLPWKKSSGGFIGLNLHYLPYDLRIQLLYGLMKFASNKKMNESTRLKFTWDAINRAGKTRAANACVKRYLSSHVKSKFAYIHPDDWGKVALLPIEQFVGAGITKVWKESRRKV